MAHNLKLFETESKEYKNAENEGFRFFDLPCS